VIGIDLHGSSIATERGREFWRRALLAGAFTAIPRWTREPVAGIGEHRETISDELAAALSRLADELAVPLSSVLLTAHVKVLNALSGEREVATGYVALQGSPPLLCRVTTEPRSWRALLRETRRAELEVTSHSGFEDVKRELHLGRPLFEAVLDPNADAGGDLAEDVVLRIGVAARDGIALRLRYRLDALDAQCAARIAGYHLAALTLMTADLDAEHARQNLLSADELRFQRQGLAGPQRTVPNRRVHELFEGRVRAHPEAVAVVHRDREWTYGQLNARANQLARALVARGVRRERVVAVVAERNVDWMIAVLAIFKAGGVYLPIEPHFPADRIARMLARAHCDVVLTERGSTTTLDPALDSLSGVETVDIDAACAGHADRDLDVAVAPDQLAYIYFTSGSSGEPKGVMCEHAGMLNHLCAKIHDLAIGEGTVVAQTAPQCFDISLWQALAAILAGGRTLLVEQEAILDAGRFIDRIIGGKVAVVQVVPSYLEVVLSHLALHPRELPDLRCVSVTGEALKKELAERWFAAKPAIKLVNAYGLTETSDDTNHEIMDCVPERGRVPLGRPIQNVSAYVVDEHLGLVPLGAPGEIVFSGVCVGRGYINDPERTRQAFMADPQREGERLYRSGDYGRWLPEGKLEFLGRRDTQIKISGFRIEIGEIENALLKVPGIRDAAAIVTERGDHGRRLVAFYAGQQPLAADALRGRLRKALPEYMVPLALHWRDALPLTVNGKIDRHALTALARELAVAAQDHDEPTTATERRLAAAWAKVLGIPLDRIGRRDEFFDLGGTSLSVLQLAIALGRTVSFEDLRRHAVLADQATVIDGKLAGAAAAPAVPVHTCRDPPAATAAARAGEP
jgi:amino acid adenylation domain-containing protein